MICARGIRGASDGPVWAARQVAGKEGPWLVTLLQPRTRPGTPGKRAALGIRNFRRSFFTDLQFSRLGAFLAIPQRPKKCVALPKPGSYVAQFLLSDSSHQKWRRAPSRLDLPPRAQRRCSRRRLGRRRAQSLARLASRSSPIYILGEIRTGSPNDETLWLPNKEMTKPCEVSDETSTNLFPHF